MKAATESHAEEFCLFESDGVCSQSLEEEHRAELEQPCRKMRSDSERRRALTLGDWWREDCEDEDEDELDSIGVLSRETSELPQAPPSIKIHPVAAWRWQRDDDEEPIAGVARQRSVSLQVPKHAAHISLAVAAFPGAKLPQIEERDCEEVSESLACDWSWAELWSIVVDSSVRHLLADKWSCVGPH